ncbi:MAG: hypothetical protein ACAH12_00205 [Methylophilaceae bacterium]
MIDELKRMIKVSDLLCSSHSALHDSYIRKALCLDTAILAISVWLTAMVFVEPSLGSKLTPIYFSREIWLGFLSIGVFFLSIIQIRVDWKGLADAHDRARHFFGKIKMESRSLVSRDEVDIGPQEFKRLQEMYLAAGEINISIPESKFNSLKRKHKIKVEISKLLDLKPGISIPFTYAKIWLRDNFNIKWNI